MMHEVLRDFHRADQDLFPLKIKTEEDLKNGYHCYRTFRRPSDTRDTEEKVRTLDIDVVNRWRS